MLVCTTPEISPKLEVDRSKPALHQAPVPPYLFTDSNHAILVRFHDKIPFINNVKKSRRPSPRESLINQH